jgi:hypothetical protein
MWVEEWWWGEFGVAVVYSDGPSGSVDDAVVCGADHGAVVQGGVAA